MKIINKVTNSDYIKWISEFVKNVLSLSKITYNEVIIEDIEPSKRVFLNVDGQEYTIRTWRFYSIRMDFNGDTNGEAVEYTLYKIVDDKNGGSYGEEVDSKSTAIYWEN